MSDDIKTDPVLSRAHGARQSLWRAPRTRSAFTARGHEASAVRFRLRHRGLDQRARQPSQCMRYGKTQLTSEARGCGLSCERSSLPRERQDSRGAKRLLLARVKLKGMPRQGGMWPSRRRAVESGESGSGGGHRPRRRALKRRRLANPACKAIAATDRLVVSRRRLLRCTWAVSATCDGLA